MKDDCDYDEHAAEDPFNGLTFALCLGLIGVVVFLVGAGLQAAVALYGGTLP